MSEGFWRDLQRRRVVRVAAAYVAVAFAVLGFPAALVLSWLFDLSAEGLVRATEPASDGARPGVPRRALRLSVLGLVSVAFALGVWLWVPRTPGFRAVEADPNTLVVFPFSVRGSNEVAYLREGRVDLVSTSLDGVGGLSVLDPHVSLARLDPDAGVGRPRTIVSEPASRARWTSSFLSSTSSSRHSSRAASRTDPFSSRACRASRRAPTRRCVSTSRASRASGSVGRGRIVSSH